MKPKKPNLADLMALGLKRACDLLPNNPGAQHRRKKRPDMPHFTTVPTDSANPYELVRAAALEFPDAAFKDALRTLLSNPSLISNLTWREQKVCGNPSDGVPRIVYDAEVVKRPSLLGKVERQLLQAATLMRVIQTLMVGRHAGSSNLLDEIYDIVRPSIQRLENSSPHHAHSLRRLMGRGNEDETDSECVSQLKADIQWAVHSALCPRRQAQCWRVARRCACSEEAP